MTMIEHTFSLIPLLHDKKNYMKNTIVTMYISSYLYLTIGMS